MVRIAGLDKTFDEAHEAVDETKHVVGSLLENRDDGSL